MRLDKNFGWSERIFQATHFALDKIKVNVFFYLASLEESNYSLLYLYLCS